MTEAEFLKCCGSVEWARRMARVNGEDPVDAAERIWWSLTPDDWLEAFRAHPRIGEKADSEISGQEQAGARGASREAIDELRELNRAYEERFGYIFIVRATGKTAEEMLAILKRRIGNEPEMELRIAAGQQLEIARLRLQNMLPS